MAAFELERANVLSAISQKETAGSSVKIRSVGHIQLCLGVAYSLFLEFSLIQTFLIVVLFLICPRPCLNQSKTNGIPWWLLLNYIHAVALWCSSAQRWVMYSQTTDLSFQKRYQQDRIRSLKLSDNSRLLSKSQAKIFVIIQVSHKPWNDLIF